MLKIWFGRDMKKTQFIDIITTIKRTIVVFLSIMMFVSISVSIYTGFSWSSKAVLVNLDLMIEEQKLHDAEIYIPFGVTEDDIKRISENDLVSEIEGTRITYQTTTIAEKNHQLKVTQINDTMDLCYVVTGQMPTTADEIAIEEHAANRMGLNVGDTITFNASSSTNAASCDLVNNEYVITALVNNPECTLSSDNWYGYALTNGLLINGYAYVLEEAFHKELFEDYNEILIRSDSLRGYDTSSTEYNNRLDALEMSVQSAVDDIINEKNGIIAENAEDFERKTASLGSIGSIILTRKHNSGVQLMSLFSKIMKNEKYSMASLFLIIGILVCYFAILRIVNNQVVLIGTQKANGFYKKEILTKYLLYTGVAIAIGCVIGVFAGKYIVEYVICSALKGSVNIRELKTIMQGKDILAISVLEIGLLLFVTWLATVRILERNAIQLLSGEIPKADKGHYYEKLKIWQKMSLFSKTVISNFFTDHRRVFGTFIGIAGCASLFVTAFTLQNNILNSFTEQYEKYYHFDTTISFEAADEKAADSIRRILDDYGLDYTEVFSSSVAVDTADGNVVSGSLWVPMNYEAFSDIVYVKPDDNSKKDTNSGVWMSSAYGNYYGKNSENQFMYLSGDGTEIATDIDGYFVNYLNGLQLIMDKDTYYDNYGKEATGNCFLVNCEPLGMEQLNGALSKLEVNYAVRAYKASTYGTFNAFAMVSKSMVLIYVVLAIVMALLVVLTLLTMFVDEKRKELIVLMINGYSTKAAKKYISSDTVLLTILGIIGGEILGCIVGNLSVKGFDTATTKFMLAIDWQAVLIGMIGTAIISFVMCQIAVRKVSKFKLSDINK